MTKRVLNSETCVLGTFQMTLMALKSKIKKLLLKRLFPKMNGLKATAIGTLNIEYRQTNIQVVEWKVNAEILRIKKNSA